MELFHKHPLHLSLIFSLIGVLFLGITALFLSGKLRSTNTTLVKPKATEATPKVTQFITDEFTAPPINTTRWQTSAPKVGSLSATIQQTTTGNLRIDIPSSTTSGQIISGSVMLKQALPGAGDYRIIAVVFRPIVTGTGTGISGVRVSIPGTNQYESMEWVVNGQSSKVVYKVSTNAGSVPILVKEATLDSTVAVFRLIRVNSLFQGKYSLGNDTTPDVPSILLGETGSQDAMINRPDSNVTLYANNSGTATQVPNVVSKFDSISVGWGGAPATTFTFSDAFASGMVGAKWAPVLSAGTTISETAANNLLITIPAGSVNAVRRKAFLHRIEPIVGAGKDFVFNAQIFKPTVTGAGSGYVGIQYVTATHANSTNLSSDFEDVRLVWRVNGATSRLKFDVADATGKLNQKAIIDVPAVKYDIKIERKKGIYKAWYRLPDPDKPWIQIGTQAPSVSTLDGKLSLFANNSGEANLFPKVLGKFDKAGGTIQK